MLFSGRMADVFHTVGSKMVITPAFERSGTACAASNAINALVTENR